MLECTVDDIYDVLVKAPNINSAVKNFLKKEAKKGQPSEKFAKSLRDAFGSKNEERAKRFIDDSMTPHMSYIYSITCYAYFEFVSKLAEAIVNKFADDFNSTFEIVDEKVNFKDEKKFKTISEQALKIINENLNEFGFTDSNFMKNVALISVFERPVIDILTPNLH